MLIVGFVVVKVKRISIICLSTFLLNTSLCYSSDDEKKLSSSDFLKKVLEQNLNIGIFKDNTKAQLAGVDANWGIYDPTIGLEHTRTRDKSDPDIFVASNNFDIANSKASVSKKFSAGITSEVFAKSENKTFDGPGNLSATPPTTREYELNRKELGVNISLDLLKNSFGKIDRHLIKNWGAQKELEELDLEEKIESFILSSAVQYYNWVLSKKALDINNEIYENAESLLKNARRKARDGIVNDRELFIHKANVSNVNNSIIDLKKQQQEVFEDIRYLLDQDAEKDLYTDYPEGELTVTQKEENEIKAAKELKNNIPIDDLRLTKIKLSKSAISNNNVVINKSSILPTLKLSAGATGIGNRVDADDSADDATSFDKPTYFAGVNLSFPIGNTAARSNYKKAKSLASSDQMALKDTKNQLTTDIRKQIIDLTLLRELVESSKTHLQNEDDKFRNEIKEYNLGRRDATDLIQFQNEYLQAKLDYYKAVLDLKIALHKYLYITNKLLPYYGFKIV